MKERKTSVYLKKKKSKALLTPFLAGLFLVLCLSLNVFAADTSEADAVIPFSAAEAVKTDQTGTSGMTSKLLKSFSLLPLQSTAADSAIDFGPDITGSSISVLQDGKWVTVSTAGGEVTDGDTLKVTLSYSIPDNALSSAKNTIYYQLPDGIRPNEAMSGNVFDPKSGDTVGTYTIATDGRIEIVFSDSFLADNSGFTGDITFTGTASSDSTEDKTVNFGGAGGSITIKPKTTPPAGMDLSVKKTAGTVTSNEDGSRTVNYTVTVSSEKGTNGEAVSVTDSLTWNTAAMKYDTGSVQVVKKSGDSQTPAAGYTLTWIDDPAGWSITGLPALAAGESYEITYTGTSTTPAGSSGYGGTTNSVTGKAGDVTSSSSVSVEFWKEVISKGGTYNRTAGTIDWTVTINRDNRDIGGYVLTDSNTTGAANYKLTDSTGKEVAGFTGFPYTFPAGSTDTYTLTYSTTAPAPVEGETQKVDNTATVTDGDTSYKADASVDVNYQSGKTAKTVVGTSDDETARTVSLNWQSTITLPQAGWSTGSTFEYADTINDPSGFTGVHYGTPSKILTDLASSMKLNGYDGSQTACSDYSVTFYDINGNIIDPANYGSAQTVRFVVTFSPTADVTGQSVSFTYHTTFNYADQYAKGDAWTISNTGSTEYGDVTAEWTHKISVPSKLMKSANVTGTDSSNFPFIDDSTDLSISGSDLKDGYLYYQILIPTTQDQNGEITVEDTLPEGVTYVDGSVKGAYWSNHWYTHNTDYKDYNFDTDGTVTAEQSGNRLTIKIAEGYNANYQSANNGKPWIISVVYKVKVSDASLDANLADGVSTLVNTVTVGTDTSTQTTKVDVPKLAKEASQEDNSNIIDYKLTINRSAQTLNGDKGTLTVTDKMTLNPSSAQALFVANSLKLYEYDASKEDHLGSEVSIYDYTYTYDSDTDTLTLIVPDGHAYVAVYKYQIDPMDNAGDIKAVNNAVLAGSASSDSSSSETDYKDNSSSATATKNYVSITKVDSANYNLTLGGAKFRLEAWTADASGNYRWKQVTAGAGDEGYYVTGDDGQIYFDLKDPNNRDLSVNTLYRFTEISAPSGYSITNAQTYFVWMAGGTNESALKGSMDFDGTSADNVTFIPYSGGNIFVPNENTALRVRKVWLDASGSEMTDPSILPDISVTLYRQAMTQIGTKVTANFTRYSNTKTQELMIRKDREPIRTITAGSRCTSATRKTARDSRSSRTRCWGIKIPAGTTSETVL